MKMVLKDISSVRYKRCFFTAEDVFLSNADGKKASINYYIQVPENKNGVLNDFYTLLIDLGQEREKIWSGIYHRTQDEINSFVNNNSFEHVFLHSISIPELDRLIGQFDSFAAHKKIRKAERERLFAYNKAGILCVTYLKLKETTLCMNFYRATKLRASNIYSFNLQHPNKNDISGSIYGRAHRALHWLDMLKFKENNVAHYDFCGWYEGNEDKDLLNINKFKEQFGGQKTKEYSGSIIHHPLLKLLKR
jgi:hypothetical protein